MKYDFKAIEKKWQEIWEEKGVFHAKNEYDKPKFYALVEFPYPSGQGLHVGHPRSYTALDVVARKRRMEGYNVLYPMGWDAFGLPTENFAIKNKIHPEVVTEKNIANFKKQLQSLGLSFDWSREIDTTNPDYYKWTQWIFIQLFKKGLAYKKEMSVNWCTSCKVVLANEEVVNGVCERCGSEVVHKDKSQWMLKITEYAQRLIDDLDTVNYIERVKTQQKNWIGRSTGAEVDFKITNGDSLTVYTTRPDTLYGATYMVISPEHPMIEKNKALLKNYDEVVKYREIAAKKSDFERTEMVKEKTGVRLDGISAINPVNEKEIPIFVSDYVLMTYGTGAIMAVPAHDTRDYDFAKTFNLPMIEVVAGGNIEKEAYTDIESGTMINSGILDGLSVKDAKEKIIKFLEEKGIGHAKVNYKLRDWVFSRQRYWGEPIPLVYCEKCGWVPLDESDLPLRLPEVDSYEPTDTGESPLSKMTDWVNTTCPHCKGPAKRETDTMPQWAGSSWYFLRYTDPNETKALASEEALKYWLPVDWYNGGMEHTTLHLLYSRFWHKFLYDIGIVPTAEPYAKRTSHGMILGENNEKMSKSRGNVVNPDEIVNEYGADTLRLYEMFIGDFEKAAPWSSSSIKGCKRFLERSWSLMDIATDESGYSKELENSMHKTIKKVTEDIESLKFNTAIASLMSLLNEFYDKKKITKDELKTYILLLNPFAPHITEEMWEAMKFEGMVTGQQYPKFDESKTKDSFTEIVVQVNGKLKSRISAAAGVSQDEAVAIAKADEKVAAALEGKEIVKIIYVPNKLLNIVVK
ncbi:MAG: leucine--tRNA ligase [Ruminococcaceae bacterium]|nr:leucine--tRNA ligase [Oscillospiraceae bacterium]